MSHTHLSPDSHDRCFVCGGPITDRAMAMLLVLPDDPEWRSTTPVGAVHKGACLDKAEAAADFMAGTTELPPRPCRPASIAPAA